MADITLSSAVRSNLLSLQSTATLMGKTQERLATGLKVNSALDDPTAFFTSSSLNARAGDLNRLLDSVGNAVQTIKAADEGITSITKLVETAQATARQALQTPGGSTAATVVAGSADLRNTPATVTGSTVTGDPDATTLGFSDADTFTIDVDGTAVTFEFDIAGDGVGGSNVALAAGGGGTLLSTIISEIDAGLTNASVTDSDGGADTAIQITASGSTGDIVITDGTGTPLAALGLSAGTTSPTNAKLAAATDVVTIGLKAGGVGNETTAQLDLSTINTETELSTALGSLGLTGVTASLTAEGKVQFEGTGSKDVISVTNGTDLGIQDGSTVAHSTNREELEEQYNLLRNQIDQLAADASFNGNNLLKGDSLKVIFNENNTSSLTVSGVSFDSEGLSIGEAAIDSFQGDAGVDAALEELDGAIQTLRSQAAAFGSNLTVVEVRQDFTKALVNTLETGAANLTLADSNEEGANMLALQTRQQLSSVALSLASQADQNVLRLF